MQPKGTQGRAVAGTQSGRQNQLVILIATLRPCDSAFKNSFTVRHARPQDERPQDRSPASFCESIRGRHASCETVVLAVRVWFRLRLTIQHIEFSIPPLPKARRIGVIGVVGNLFQLIEDLLAFFSVTNS